MKDMHPTNSKADRYSAANRPASFSTPEVPEYMRQLEIDTLPANNTFYIEPASNGRWNDIPSLVIDKATGTLHLLGSAEVDSESNKPISPLGHVGIMRAETVDAEGVIKSFFVADLRFIENHELAVVNNFNNAPTNQEEFDAWMEHKKDLRETVAFIAPVPGTKASKKGIIPALYYGPEEYYGALDSLRERGDKLLSRNIQQQRRAAKLAKAAIQDETASTPAAADAVVKTVPQVIFSHK